MLTASQVKQIEANSSSYGCGRDNCVSCYPLQYGCADCEDYEDYFVFPTPILNGQEIECEQCCYVNNQDEEHTSDQLALYATYEQEKVA